MTKEKLKELGLEVHHWNLLVSWRDNNGYEYYCNNEEKFTDDEKNQIIREIVWNMENYREINVRKFIEDLLVHWRWCYDEHNDLVDSIVGYLYEKKSCQESFLINLHDNEKYTSLVNAISGLIYKLKDVNYFENPSPIEDLEDLCNILNRDEYFNFYEIRDWEYVHGLIEED